ncbi:iron-sulfur cluster assembly scaffold protein [Nitrospinae bacterium AH_259_B05_G02_I21]|nr:iron-sulfur cluster assembly scaffold protein [Nitrospinae bacterium AH_259_B05_G02_I21]MDA2932623.1 iron-sulfur cluster assembly scaffold protein [Nitrospinae bacterium AH-259-F20]
MEKLSREEQIEFIMEHYEDPINWGSMEDADVVQKIGNPGCADVITVYLKINGEGNVERISFEGEGCTLSMAGTSMVMEMVEGKTLEEVRAIPLDAVIEILGRELAMTRPKCSTLGMNAVRFGLDKYRKKKLLEESLES